MELSAAPRADLTLFVDFAAVKRAFSSERARTRLSVLHEGLLDT
jgi:hypothetical protein